MTDTQPQFAIERVYLKDSSFEVADISVFTQPWDPEVDVKLASKAEKIDENHVEVVLSITVTSKLKEKTAYIAEVHQAGIFLLSGIDDDQVPHLLGAYCPNILFPFAREVLCDLIVKGSFPQLLLQPINFDAAFAESQQAQAETQGNA